MSNHRIWGGSIRKLWSTDADSFRDHLLRLDNESRRMRFAHGVSDAFIMDYANRVHEMGSIVYGFLEGGKLRAAAELRNPGNAWASDAEAAFSVERTWQNHGLGTLLMGRIIRAARNRGIRRLYMSCLTENGKMQSIARKHDAQLRFEYGEAIGEIVPQLPSYFTVLAEDVDDRMSLMLAVLDLPQWSVKAA